MEPLEFEQEVINRIRSIMNTVDNYRRTSFALHNRSIESVRIYAEQRATEVANIASKWPDSPSIQRWARKFAEYVKQHALVEETEE